MTVIKRIKIQAKLKQILNKILVRFATSTEGEYHTEEVLNEELDLYLMKAHIATPIMESEVIIKAYIRYKGFPITVAMYDEPSNLFKEMEYIDTQIIPNLTGKEKEIYESSTI